MTALGLGLGLPFGGRSSGSLNSYVTIPGTNGNYVSTPDAAALDITGDIEIVVRVALTDWTSSNYGVFVCKNYSAYEFRHRDASAGELQAEFNSGVPVITSTGVPAGFTDNTPGWIKLTMDVDNGAGGSTGRFYKAADSTTEPVSWTQLGTDKVTAGVLTITNSANQLGIGARHDGTLAMAGRIYRAIVRSGIGGTTVADFNPNLWTSGTTFVSSDGRTYTLNGTAAITKA